MKANPILEEVWRAKDQLAAEAGYDVDRFFAQLRAWSEAHPHAGPVVRNAGELRHLAAEKSALVLNDKPARKGLKSKEHVLDHMGSTELAANLFRATQTEEKLRRENVRNKNRANEIHKDVGRKVRQTIRELGGTMPENLPVAENIKKVESREKKRLKAEQKRQLQNPPT